MKKFNTLLALIFLCSIANAQNNRIVVYEPFQNVWDTLDAVPYDTTVLFDQTDAFVGDMDSLTILDLLPPVDNLFEDTDFTKKQVAALTFDVADYPVRTSLKLFFLFEGDTIPLCTATIVAPNFILTAAHCINSISTNEFFYDSILVAPAFDNGEFFGSTTLANRFFIFEGWNNNQFNDLALIELQEPLGQDFGWMSLGFSKEDDYFENKNFHKFSYPKAFSTFDNFPYNGDTLYYCYGLIDFINDTSLGIQDYLAAVSGEGGSSLFYTDNANDYIAFGVLSFASNHSHSRISPASFYALKSVIDQPPPLSDNTPLDKTFDFRIFPNPAQSVLQLSLDADLKFPIQIQISNLVGQVIWRKTITNKHQLQIDISTLADGVFAFSVFAEGKINSQLFVTIVR